MDVVLEWKQSTKVEDLVDTLAKLKQELTNACFKKYGAAKSISVDAYASEKIVDMLRKSAMWKDVADVEETIDENDSNSRRSKSAMTTERVADLGFFCLHEAYIMGDEQVRMVVVFNTDSPVQETWFGNVMIT